MSFLRYHVKTIETQNEMILYILILSHIMRLGKNSAKLSFQERPRGDVKLLFREQVILLQAVAGPFRSLVNPRRNLVCSTVDPISRTDSKNKPPLLLISVSLIFLVWGQAERS